MGRTDDVVWFEFVESKVFSKQIGALPGEVLINIQSELVQNPQRGDIVKGTHGVRKARVADPGYIYSAKVTKPTYHRIKRASLAR